MTSASARAALYVLELCLTLLFGLACSRTPSTASVGPTGPASEPAAALDILQDDRIAHLLAGPSPA